MDISYLSEFLSLSELLNYSKTAETLRMSQPALSNHIQALEDELGVKLFERTKRKVALTQEGRLLTNDAQKILKLFEDMHRFNQRELIENHVVTVGGFLENPEVLGMLAMRIRDFAASEGLSIKLLCDYDPVNVLSQKLLDRKLNFLVAYENSLDSFTDSRIASVPFHRDPFAVVVNQQNPLANRTSVTLGELRDLRFIKLANPVFDSGWKQITTACERQGFTPQFHSVYIDSLYDCPFIDIDVNKCFIFANGGFSGGMPFRAQQDLAVIPIADEGFSISLFYNSDDMHPLLQRFVGYLEAKA